MAGWSRSQPQSAENDEDKYAAQSDIAGWPASETSIESAGFSTTETGNELANTPFPPPGMDPRKAAAQLALLKGMTRNARIFYEADKDLTREDRNELFAAFRTQMYAQYIGAGIGLAIGIQGPKYLCKYLGRPYRSAYSTVGCFVSLVVSYSAAERWALARSWKRFEGNERYRDILRSVDRYPPIIGYTYYNETRARPASAFPDPSLFNWIKYPPFPIVLTTFTTYNMELKGQNNQVNQPGEIQERVPTESQERIPARFPEPRPVPVLERQQPTQPVQSSTSAWDRIRSENANKPFKWEPQHPQSSGPSDWSQPASINRPPPSDLDTFQDPFEEDSK